MNVGDFIIKRLAAWGVTRIFGYPGDGINGILGALGRSTEPVKFTQVRHEEMAALMACAHAKFTGEVGVCLATSGPGAIHLLNGLYDAKLDHQPVVAIVGHPARMAIGGHYQQEVDLISLFKDVAHEYIHMASDASQVRHLIDRAIRIAKAERTVTCVVIPNDVQTMEAVETPPHEHYAIHTGIGHPSSILIPTDDALQKAAHVLNTGERDRYAGDALWCSKVRFGDHKRALLHLSRGEGESWSGHCACRRCEIKRDNELIMNINILPGDGEVAARAGV